MKRPNQNKAVRQLRRDGAAERAAKRESISDMQQLVILTQRTGNSTRERTRLQSRIDKKMGKN